MHVNFQERAGVWRQKSFFYLWMSQSVSLLGSQVTALVLPTLAIIVLHADAFSVGVLIALQWLAFLFLGPIAGTLVDQLPKRIILIVADIGRLLALSSIPLAFALGVRTMLQLYVVAAIVGAFTVFFDIAYQSYLPMLIASKDLMEGNAKLTLSEGASQIGGPALAGGLIQLFGAASALWADALSYFFSLLFLVCIRDQEKIHRVYAKQLLQSFFSDLRAGAGIVFRHPVLRTIVTVNTVQCIGASLAEAVILVFVYRVLHLSPGLVGIVTAMGGIGFILGAVIASPLAYKLGVGWMLIVSSLAGACAYGVLPFGLFGMPVLIVFLWRFFFGLYTPTYDINQISLRQAITPIQFQGRMNAIIRTLSWGAYGIASIVGGFLGSRVGLVPTIMLGVIIYLVGTLPLFSRVIRKVKYARSSESHEAFIY